MTYAYLNLALLGHYAASSGNFLPTFRDNLSAPKSVFKNPKQNYHHSPRNDPEECSSQQLRGGSLNSRTYASLFSIKKKQS